MDGNELEKLNEFQIAIDDIDHRLKLVEEIGKNIKRSPVIYGYHGKRLDLNDNLDVLKFKRSIESGDTITNTINNVTTLTSDVSQLSLSNLPSDPLDDIDCKNQKITNLFTPVLSGDAVNKSYVDAISSLTTSHISDTSNPHSVTKTQVGLGNVENTALSTWAGTMNITTLGTISTGTWQGTAIDHERGGLEADVSAYDGLLKISGGVTSAITDNSTNWDTAYTHSQDNTQAHSDYLINNGNDITSGTLTMASGSVIGTLTLADGSITDSGGSIDFGNENLTTSGNIVLDTGYVDSKAYYYINGTKVISVDGTGNAIFGSGITCTGNYCALIGLSASANISGDYNCIVAYGNYAGLSGSRNVFLGGFAGRITTTGSYNLFIGYRAGYNNIGGNYNSGFGYYTLYNTTTNSQNNLGFGAQAGYSNTIGNYNLYIGENTGLFQQTGSENVFIGGGAGYGAGAAAYSADKHVAIGRYALYNATNGTSRNVCIGYQAGYYETGSYKLFIDNDDRANEADGRVKALIYGIFNAATASQLLLVNGYLWNREGLCGYERSSDPTEPAEGEYVIWMSDGTGKGDDGDIMIASKAGGTTNYGTLFDHSGGAAW